MNTQKEEQYNILNGPSKDLIFDALKYAYDKKIIVPIWFKVVKDFSPLGTTIGQIHLSGIRLKSIEYGDGAADKINICGYCKANLESPDKNGPHSPYGFKALYNTRTRSGYISFSQTLGY